jgi:hypothetical protein
VWGLRRRDLRRWGFLRIGSPDLGQMAALEDLRPSEAIPKIVRYSFCQSLDVRNWDLRRWGFLRIGSPVRSPS